MKQQPIADLYSDYLLASFGATTATGLSQLLEGAVSHDQVTRYLAGTQKTAADLWRTVKPLVRQVQAAGGVLLIDDSIEEKPYTDENEIVCWHYDHAKERMLKGINFLTALYSSQGVSLPVGFPLVATTEQYVAPQTQQEKRRSPVSKNVGVSGVDQASGDQRHPLSLRALRCLVCLGGDHGLHQTATTTRLYLFPQDQSQGRPQCRRQTPGPVYESGHPGAGSAGHAGNLSGTSQLPARAGEASLHKRGRQRGHSLSGLQ